MKGGVKGREKPQAVPWWRRLNDTGAPIVLGLLFLVAGGAKVLDPWSFRAALDGYGVPDLLRTPITLLLPAIEVALAGALLFRWRLRLAGATAAALMVIFLAAIAYGWSSGTLEECGCFGPLAERSPRDAFLADLVFLALAVGIWTVGGRSASELSSMPFIGLAGAGVVALAMTLGAFTSGPTGVVAAMSASGPATEAIDLRRGEHLLYLFHHECPHCQRESPKVAEYTRDGALPPVVGYTFETRPEDIDAFRASYGLEIPVQVLPGETFVRITGRGQVPQLVYLRDGEIVESWMGLLPAPDSLRRALTES